ncbi:MAG TPA: tetratricopeptide repeat protein [bacterium]|jgi:tetratricopeptide (TPR) repeat protein
MYDIAKELKRAQAELRAGSMDRAAEILHGLERALRKTLNKAESGSDREASSRRALLKVLNNLGVVHKNLGDLDAATVALEKALQVAEVLHAEGVRARAGILSNLGLVYSRRRMYSKSLEAFDQALFLATENPSMIEPDMKIKLHNNRALFFVRFGQPDKARDELSLALESSNDDEDVVDSSHEVEREAWLNANLALIHVEIGDEEIVEPVRQEEFYRIARTLFLKSAQLYKTQEYIHHMLKQEINASEIEIRLGFIEDARKRLQKARKQAGEMNSGRLLCDIAQAEVELAMRTARKNDIENKVKNAAKEFKKHKPADVNSRLAKMEGMLRRSGKGSEIEILTKLLTGDKPENSSGD